VSDLFELEELAPLVGNAWTFGDRVSAESMAALAPHATPAPGDFIVAGVDFGLGDACREAIAALENVGVAAVIGRSFAPRFHRAAIEAGLPALVIEETGAIKRGDRLRIDIERYKIANLSSGDRYIIRNLSDETLEILRAGGLSPLLAAYGRAAGRTRH
jgi:3-isopropylmalate/(R)-2-methylmalate dehydratase small subunit